MKAKWYFQGSMKESHPGRRQRGSNEYACHVHMTLVLSKVASVVKEPAVLSSSSGMQH